MISSEAGAGTILFVYFPFLSGLEAGGESGEVGGADQILQLIETDTRDSSSNLLTLPPVEMSLY